MWAESFILSAIGVLCKVVCLSPGKVTQQTTKQGTWQDHTARWLLCAGSVFCHSEVSVLGGWLGRKMSHLPFCVMPLSCDQTGSYVLLQSHVWFTDKSTSVSPPQGSFL